MPTKIVEKPTVEEDLVRDRNKRETDECKRELEKGARSDIASGAVAGTLTGIGGLLTSPIPLVGPLIAALIIGGSAAGSAAVGATTGAAGAHARYC